MLALLRRVLDEGFIDPLLEDPTSAAVINALAAMAARMGDASTHNLSAGAISLAPGAAPGTTNALLSRTAGAGGTIPKGTAFTDHRGIKYNSLHDVVVPAGAVTNLPVTLATLRKTELVNTVDPPTLTFDGAAPLGLAITSATPVTGGALDYISLLGRERGNDRQGGEETDDYRARVRNIPDAVSPLAVSIAARGAAQSVGLPPPVVLEPFDDFSTTTTDENAGLGSFTSLYLHGDGSSYAGTVLSPLAFAWDEPASVYLTNREAAAYFKLTFPTDSTGSTGLMADPDLSRAFLNDAYWDDSIYGFLDVGALSGLHFSNMAALMTMYDSVTSKKAAGVNFDLEMVPFQTLLYSGTSSIAGEAMVFTATPPTGKRWWIQNSTTGLVGNTGTPAAFAYSYLVFTFEDGSSYTSPLWGADTQTAHGASFRHSGNTPAFGMQRVTQVQGWLSPASVNTKLLSIIKVLEVAA